MTSKKISEATDLIQPKSSSDLIGLTSDLFQSACNIPVCINSGLIPACKNKLIRQPLAAQLYQNSGLAQVAYLPQSSIFELPKQKINLNLARSSGPTISQLQFTPLLNQQPNTEKKEIQSSKPKNLEEALLNLDDLGAYLISSKNLPSARMPSFNY